MEKAKSIIDRVLEKNNKNYRFSIKYYGEWL